MFNPYNRPCDLDLILFGFYGCKNRDGGNMCLHLCMCMYVAHELALFVSIDNGYHR